MLPNGRFSYQPYRTLSTSDKIGLDRQDCPTCGRGGRVDRHESIPRCWVYRTTTCSVRPEVQTRLLAGGRCTNAPASRLQRLLPASPDAGKILEPHGHRLVPGSGSGIQAQFQRLLRYLIQGAVRGLKGSIHVQRFGVVLDRAASRRVIVRRRCHVATPCLVALRRHQRRNGRKRSHRMWTWTKAMPARASTCPGRTCPGTN